MDERYKSDEALLECVKKNIAVMIGDPDLKFHVIEMDTKFGSDLELESIEFVVLAERLRAEFGESVNFVEFLSGRTVDEIVSLRVGDVVNYIAQCRRGVESTQGEVAHG